VDLPFLRQKISTSSTPIFVSSEAENFLRAPSTPAAGFSGVHRILFPRSLGSGDEREVRRKMPVAWRLFLAMLALSTQAAGFSAPHTGPSRHGTHARLSYSCAATLSPSAIGSLSGKRAPSPSSSTEIAQGQRFLRRKVQMALWHGDAHDASVAPLTVPTIYLPTSSRLHRIVRICSHRVRTVQQHRLPASLELLSGFA